MGQALYRKYRSKSLDEIIGQEHITTTPRNAFAAGKISHAYLFTGPRGVGKTSVARIVAFEINGLPYDETRPHLDIIEIDAASNRRIDEIRDLRDKVHNAPTSAKYKVYIIDEVHMLTREAFNALLKTLEEPPAHAVFILATTESHKLPDTIISRTQRFTFKPVEPAQAVSHLKHIASQEGITIADDALSLIAAHGQGSFRDSISLLDQVSSISDTVSLADVQRTLGIAPAESIDRVMDCLINGQAGPLLSSLTSLREQGYQAAQISEQLAQRIRQDITSGHISSLFPLLKPLLEVPAGSDPNTALELALLSYIFDSQPAAATATIAITALPDDKPAMTAAAAPAVQAAASQPPAKAAKPDKPNKPGKSDQPGESTEVTVEAVVAVDTAPSEAALSVTEQADQPVSAAGAITLDADAWEQVLVTIKQRYNTLYSLARMADARFDNDKLHLSFGLVFHQKRINEAKNKQIIADIIKQLTGRNIEIVCTVTTKPTKTKAASAQSNNANSVSIEAIAKIFGGAEVME